VDRIPLSAFLLFIFSSIFTKLFFNISILLGCGHGCHSGPVMRLMRSKMASKQRLDAF
jgi:5-bromo-4-chloroindolyl phosphate hydrolysis protein